MAKGETYEEFVKELGGTMSDYLKAEIIHSVTNAALLIAWASFVYWRIKNLK